MKNILLSIFFLVFLVSSSNAQNILLNEGFETSDSINLPAGWSVWHNGNFVPGDTAGFWRVRDTGVCVTGINCARTSKANTGRKSIMVSWTSGVDSGGMNLISDNWLVTKRIRNVPADGLVEYYAAGGSPSYLDSMQIWVSTVDSMPNSFNNYIESVIFPRGSTYGNFQKRFINLSSFAGQTVWVGFRYHTDVSVDGYVVYIDDVKITGTVGINQIGTNVPDKFDLRQNYPNPFNPATKINFDLAKNSNVKLVVYNSLGQEVAVLADGFKTAGYYEADFNASSLPSGTYFYRLITDSFTETKKMQLVK